MWFRIIDWFGDVQERYVLVRDFNKSAKGAFITKNSVALDSRQEIKFALKDFKGCLEDCNSAILINDKLSNSYFFRGLVYHKQGNKFAACQEWNIAFRLGNQKADAYLKKYCAGVSYPSFE